MSDSMSAKCPVQMRFSLPNKNEPALGLFFKIFRENELVKTGHKMEVIESGEGVMFLSGCFESNEMSAAFVAFMEAHITNHQGCII